MCCRLSLDLLLIVSEFSFISKQIIKLISYKSDILKAGNITPKRKIMNCVARFMPFRIWFNLMWLLRN